ncbi:MAG TPA: aldo/keto reductase [Candidatus Nanopelagicales bacterium]|jgi:aryl-alcohol dehydrogenase-like predicted oxidoreductase
MEYTHLGRTGLRVSRICLGTMNFGPVTDEPDAHAIMDRAHDRGINFFDTANVYGWDENKGRTERIIGNWFAQGGGRRERTVIATKLYAEMGTWPNDGKLSALNIRRACDASLQRLQTDHIDLYQMHHVDRAASWDEIWEAMEVLRQQGKIIYVGSSNFAGWHIAQAQEVARRRNFLGLTSEQSIYNLVERTVELEVLPAAQAYGLGIIPWSPLHGGLLGGILRKQADGTAKRSTGGRASNGLAKHRPAIEEWEHYCDERGEGPGDVALAWLLHQPAVTAPIVGPRTADQLDGALRALEITLDEKALARIDDMFPGPGGTAPEAYAW